MKSIKRDQSAEEQLLGPFVFIGLLLIMSAILVASAGNIVASNRYSNFEYETGYAILGGTEYNYLDPTGGYPITLENVTDNWDDDSEYNLVFDGSTLSVDDLRVTIVRDNAVYEWSPGIIDVKDEFLYLDYIMIYTSYGWWSHDSEPIPIDTVIQSQEAGTNMSVCPFTLHDQNYSLVIVTPGEADDHAGFIENNIYTVYVGVPMFAPDLADVTMWKLIGMIATGNLPETEPTIDLILMAMFWLTAGFMIAMIVSRFIPLIAGG